MTEAPGGGPVRFVVDGRSIEARAGDSIAVAIAPRRRGPGTRRHPVPRGRLRELPCRRRWRRVRSDVPDDRRGGRRGGAAPGRREPAAPRWRGSPGRAGRTAGRRRPSSSAAVRPGRLAASRRPDALVLDAGDGIEVAGIYPGPDRRGEDAVRGAPRRGRGDRRRDRGRRDPAGLPRQRPDRDPDRAGSGAAARGGRGPARAGRDRRPASRSASRAMPPGGCAAVVLRERATARESTIEARTVVVDLGLAPRDVLARMAGPTVPVEVVGDAAVDHPLPIRADRPVGGRLPLHGRHGRRPGRGVGRRLHRAGAAQARDARGDRHLPGRGMPAARPRLDRRPDRGRARAVHRPARRPPDQPRRGRGRRLGRRLPADRAPRRAPRARRDHGPLRRLVAAVALRRRARGVPGGPRGGLGGRRQHARQAGRQRPGRRGGARADLPVPRRGHQARPVALRAAAQRARPRHGRRDDPARVGDPVRADVHERRRRERRDVAPRLDRHLGPPRPRPRPDDVPRRDQRHGAARRGAAAAGSGWRTRRASSATPTSRWPASRATRCACRSPARRPGSCTTRSTGPWSCGGR